MSTVPGLYCFGPNPPTFALANGNFLVPMPVVLPYSNSPPLATNGLHPGNYSDFPDIGSHKAAAAVIDKGMRSTGVLAGTAEHHAGHFRTTQQAIQQSPQREFISRRFLELHAHLEPAQPAVQIPPVDTRGTHSCGAGWGTSSHEFDSEGTTASVSDRGSSPSVSSSRGSREGADQRTPFGSEEQSASESKSKGLPLTRIDPFHKKRQLRNMRSRPIAGMHGDSGACNFDSEEGPSEPDDDDESISRRSASEPQNSSQDSESDMEQKQLQLKRQDAQERIWESGEVDVNELLKNVPVDANGLPKSIGSIGHSEQACNTPCYFAHTSKGCAKGIHCSFCHFRHNVRNPRPRPCKSKRDRYRKNWEKIRAQIEANPEDFDPEAVPLPAVIVRETRLQEKLKARMKKHKELVVSQRLPPQEWEESQVSCGTSRTQ